MFRPSVRIARRRQTHCPSLWPASVSAPLSARQINMEPSRPTAYDGRELNSPRCARLSSYYAVSGPPSRPRYSGTRRSSSPLSPTRSGLKNPSTSRKGEGHCRGSSRPSILLDLSPPPLPCAGGAWGPAGTARTTKLALPLARCSAPRAILLPGKCAAGPSPPHSRPLRAPRRDGF